MQGTCKLCRSYGELEKSHFIPKFVVRWLKKTSITGYIREASEPQRRIQDLPKDYWLCGGCEDRFSAWEAEFAKRVFYPFVDEGESVAAYDEWMLNFCASISWRTLTYMRSRNTRQDKLVKYGKELDLAERHMAEFLLGRTGEIGQYEQHLIPWEAIASTTIHSLPPNFNRYLLRTPAASIVWNANDLLTFTKLPHFMILGFIQIEGDVREKMEPSKITSSGMVSPRDYWLPGGFDGYLFGQAKKVSEAYNRIPKEHLKKFDDYIAKNPDKAANSKLFEALLHDHRQFGDAVFRK